MTKKKKKRSAEKKGSEAGIPPTHINSREQQDCKFETHRQEKE